jgi:basic membrane protein A
VRFVEPGDGSDREAGLRLLAAENMDLVVGVGFIFTDDLLVLAQEYPKVHFAGVDLALRTDEKGDPLPLPPNLAALKFREEEGSFLVGALAALVGGSKKLGFVGGMDIPLIHKFEQGYRQGVLAVCPDCSVIAQYAGVTPEAFRNPGKGKELALSQYGAGVNVIFHAAGSTGLGVFEAARSNGKLGIGRRRRPVLGSPGLRADLDDQGCRHLGLRRDRAGEERHLHRRTYNFGLAENGVGYVYDENNKKLIPDAARERVEALRQEIIAGKIKVTVKQ